MSSPIIILGTINFKGNVSTISGTVDFQGNTGSVRIYLDSVPSGTVLGPFDAVVTGSAFVVDHLPVGIGRWKVRAVVVPNTGINVETVSASKSVLGVDCNATMPLPGGYTATPVIPDGLEMDLMTQRGYAAAIVGAAAGARRAAAANYLITTFGPTPRVCIYRNGVPVIVALSSTPLQANTSNEGSIRLMLGTIGTSTTLMDANLTVGRWTFSIQGGNNLVREIRGTVGNISSNKHMKLSSNPEVGAYFESQFLMELPAAIDP